MKSLIVLLFALCTVCSTPALAADNYRVIDLGVLGISESSYARDINYKGEIVGDLSDGGTFIYDATNGMRYLDNAGRTTTAHAINDCGQIVGQKVYVSNLNPTLWENGVPFEITNFGIPYDINNSGCVVGSTGTPNARTHAAVWDSVGGTRDIGTLAGPSAIYANSCAYDINDAGQVVGMSDASNGSNSRPFIWDKDNGMREIAELSAAYAINDLGVVAGATRTGRAAIWSKPSGVRELGLLQNWQSAYTVRINNVGQVVGRATYTSGGSCWFVWDETNGMQVLPETWGNAWIGGINDKGQIVGYKYYSTVYDPFHGYRLYDTDHAALWQPVPEPSSLLIVSLGVSGILWRRKK